MSSLKVWLIAIFFAYSRIVRPQATPRTTEVARDGIVPFTHKVYWDVRLELEDRDRRLAEAAAADGFRNAPRRDVDGAATSGGAGGQPHGRPARRRNAPRDEDGDSRDARASSREEDVYGDGDAAFAAQRAHAGGAARDFDVAAEILEFTQSEDQPGIENMSQGAQTRELLRSRQKKKVAQSALKDFTENKMRRDAERLTTANRAKDLFHLEGGVTGAAAMGIAAAAYD